MHIAFKFALFLAVVTVIISTVDAQFFGLGTTSTTTTTTTAKPKSATCSLACGTSEDMVCASNGITYKNSCRYECAKTRNKRLRMIKKGQCGNTRTTSLSEYRRGQKTAGN